jgi:hypothetical protein
MVAATEDFNRSRVKPYHGWLGKVVKAPREQQPISFPPPGFAGDIVRCKNRQPENEKKNFRPNNYQSLEPEYVLTLSKQCIKFYSTLNMVSEKTRQLVLTEDACCFI